jgi:hypothetical protein
MGVRVEISVCKNLKQVWIKVSERPRSAPLSVASALELSMNSWKCIANLLGTNVVLAISDSLRDQARHLHQLHGQAPPKYLSQIIDQKLAVPQISDFLAPVFCWRLFMNKGGKGSMQATLM